MEREYINIIDLCIDERYWEPNYGDRYLTGHSHLGSTIETYDSCDNCDGALCHKCTEVTRSLEWEFKISVLDAEDMLVSKGVPREEARDIVTCDGSYIPDSNYRMKNPNQFELKEEYPEFYKKINEIDKDIMKVIDKVIDKHHPTIFGDLERMVFDELELTDQARYNSHEANQLRLYWFRNKKNHKLACKIKEK